jgi:hypothetical protein
MTAHDVVGTKDVMEVCAVLHLYVSGTCRVQHYVSAVTEHHSKEESQSYQ